MTVAPPAPPAPRAVAPPPSSPAPPRTGARVIAIVMIVVGALIAVGTVGSAAVSAASALAVRTDVRSASSAGISELSLDVSAADLRVEFARVPDVELQVTGRTGAQQWTLDTEGGTLRVATLDLPQSGPFDRGDTAVLRLPRSLAGLDADLTIDAGDLAAQGDFGDLVLDVTASDADVEGTAESVDLRLEAGDVDLSLANVDTAAFTVSLGDLTADLVGGQPASVDLDASASDVEVTVAPGDYLLTGDMTDTDLVDTDLVSTLGASSTVHAVVSFADVTVSSGR